MINDFALIGDVMEVTLLPDDGISEKIKGNAKKGLIAMKATGIHPR